ncbi:hypothetical protein H5410_045447 [Solanum commersonii]|uniref:Pectinesterase inhibitor domain-containing protein n=1 Tax=Solanum commersonii TaxID=4109 RepID=A0A9J5XBM7_SOLCO|nr:hypothetical protein H5410_045447 [Solanum commersonii]
MKLMRALTSTNYKLCVDSLRADPRSFSAADKKGLTLIMLQLSLAKANDIYNQALILLKQPMEPILKQCIQICRDNYALAVFDLKDLIKYLVETDLHIAKTDVNSVISFSVTCEESFTEWHPLRKDPFKKKSDTFFNSNVIILCLLDLL